MVTGSEPAPLEIEHSPPLSTTGGNSEPRMLYSIISYYH